MRPTLTPLAQSLPSTVPFTGPEALERRAGGVSFRARVGANESGFGPSPTVIAAIAAAAGEVWKYGDPEVHGLKAALAAHLGIPAANVGVGEGIDGLHGLIARLITEPGDVAVTSLGHCPPVITKTLTEQGGKLIHCSNWYQIREQGELGQFITETVMEFPGKSVFCNSGAEANEALIKLARKFGHATPLADGTPRTHIITFTNSFHGRTYAGISATGQEKVKIGFAPLVPGFTHLPYNDLDAVSAALTDETVAILVEPVQGEGGVNIATPEFLRGLAKICQDRNIL